MRKGLEILLNTYWNSSGWEDGTISKEDFEVAKKKDLCLIILNIYLMISH